jgi:hypothetical protein
MSETEVKSSRDSRRAKCCGNKDAAPAETTHLKSDADRYWYTCSKTY